MRGQQPSMGLYDHHRYPVYPQGPLKHRPQSYLRQSMPRTRLDNSLGELTKKFIVLIQSSESREIDLNEAAEEL
jgi:hypothetical protein